MRASATDSPLAGWGLPDSDEDLLPLNNASTQLELGRVIKTGPGILYGLTVTNTKASAQFVLIYDALSIGALSGVPLIGKSVPASDAVGFNWLPGRTFLVGIVVVNSSTQASYSAGAKDCLFDAQFV